MESPGQTGPVTGDDEAVMVSWPSFSARVMLANQGLDPAHECRSGACSNMSGVKPTGCARGQASGRQIPRPLRRTRATRPAELAALPDEALLEAVQRQTFRFFWEGGHPVSGTGARPAHAARGPLMIRWPSAAPALALMALHRRGRARLGQP